MEKNLNLILLAIFFLLIIFMGVDSILVKWIKIRIQGDTIIIHRLFRKRKQYNLSKELFTWKRVKGYSIYGGNGYLLLMRFKNGDAYQVDSSYSIENYENVYRTFKLKYSHLLEI